MASQASSAEIRFPEEARTYWHASRWVKLRRRPIKTLVDGARLYVARASSHERLTRARTFFGDELVVALPDPVSFNLMSVGFLEEGITKAVLADAPRGDFIDIGAHVGYFTCLAARVVPEGARVHAFEPSPSTFGILARNAASKPNVVLNQSAVYDRSGSLDFVDHGLRFAALNSAEWRGGPLGRASRNVSVPATSLDEYVEKEKCTPAFIKVDAENAELAILRGAEKTLAGGTAVVALEVGDPPGDATGRSRELVETMIGHGYRPFEFIDAEWCPHEPRERYALGNLLFRP